jgi:hypothetical protein
LDRTWWANKMASYIARLHTFRLFLWGHMKNYVYREPVKSL